jgi:uncharacterized protein
MSIERFKAFVVNKISEEISDVLTYHGLHHTLEVFNTCQFYIKELNIPQKDADHLLVAALLHDIGIMWDYFNHEARSVAYAKEILPDWGYSEDDIDVISNIILATKIPQQPNTILEKIICDADLDYLGTQNFHPIAETLYKEFLAYGVVKDEQSWDALQIKFLGSHSFHTDFAKANREPVKQQFLKEIKQKWGVN